MPFSLRWIRRAAWALLARCAARSSVVIAEGYDVDIGEEGLRQLRARIERARRERR